MNCLATAISLAGDTYHCILKDGHEGNHQSESHSWTWFKTPARLDYEQANWKAKYEELLVKYNELKVNLDTITMERDDLDGHLEAAISHRQALECHQEALEEQINDIADALGDETEWSNCNDRGENALRIVKEVMDELKTLHKKAEEDAYGQRTQ
jgi:chromosome segregation ATPase